MLEQLEYRRVALKRDSKLAMLVLKEAARRESAVELTAEEAPVGDRQANGIVENVGDQRR